MIYPLTSLRFFAAMMVLIHHYFGFEAGYAGVGFFFVLSGFVLGLNYAGRVETPGQRRDFWFRRFARIYPTHLLTFLATLPVGWPILDTLPSIVLLQSWIPFQGFYYTVNAPAWSISTEAAFYALFPLLLGIRGRTLLLWLAALCFLALAWALTFPALGFDTVVRVWKFDMVPTRWLFYILPLTRVIEFAIGIWLATVVVKKPFRTGHECAAIGLAAASIAALPFLPASFQFALFFVPASAALVLVFSRSTGLLSRLLEQRALVLLGDASFMLYMIHWPIALYLGKSLATAALAVVLSVALHLAFERPVNRWLLRRWKSWSARREVPGAPIDRAVLPS